MRLVGKILVIALKVIAFAVASVISSFLAVTLAEIGILMIALHRVNLHNYDAGYLQPLNYALLALLSLFIFRLLVKWFLLKPKSLS